jgi:transposase
MNTIGLDVHKRVVEAVVLRENGSVAHRERFACSREELVRFGKKWLGPKARVALEATTNTWSVVEVLRPLAAEVVVSNPMRTRAIAEAKIKTDKVDAFVLAQLLRADFLPRVWQPDPRTQERRRLTTRRASLNGDRTRIKNRIHAVLHQRMIEPPMAALFGTKGMAWLQALELDSAGRVAIESELRLLGQVEKEIEAVSEALAVDGYDDPRVRLLITLPGVDVAVAQTLLAALGDIHRFKDPDAAASYLGLVPSIKQSAEKCYHGPITKQGKAHARWILVQAAQNLGAHPGPLGSFFRRLVKRKNRNVAVVAAARKLVTIAWHMLKNNEPYRYAIPYSTEKKLARLRVVATGEQRRRGPKKGVALSDAYGTGKRTKTIPSLDTIYEREGLPPTAPLPRGEMEMLHREQMFKFLEQSRTPQKITSYKPNSTENPSTATKRSPRSSQTKRSQRKTSLC